ncbi:MAG: DUF1294 domain-containing protein [Pseudomonadota bacterium]
MAKPSAKRTNPYIFFGAWIAGLALFATVAAYLFSDLSLLGAYGLGINFAAFVLMGLDKSLATSGSLRAPEKVLFSLAALGGGAGILLGMHTFRHKTKKVAFQCVLMLIFMAQFFIASKLGIELRGDRGYSYEAP